MIPGSNILNTALTVIAKQAVTYYEYLSRALNDVGQDVSIYAQGRIIYGSFQPLPKNLYTQYGLDLQKSYFVFYTSNNIKDVRREISGDQLVFDGQRFQCESNTEWYALDGWKGILCVLIQDPLENPLIFGFNQNPQINDNFNFNNGGFVND